MSGPSVSALPALQIYSDDELLKKQLRRIDEEEKRFEREYAEEMADIEAYEAELGESASELGFTMDELEEEMERKKAWINKRRAKAIAGAAQRREQEAAIQREREALQKQQEAERKEDEARDERLYMEAFRRYISDLVLYLDDVEPSDRTRAARPRGAQNTKRRLHRRRRRVSVKYTVRGKKATY